MDDRELLHWIVNEIPEDALHAARMALGEVLPHSMLRTMALAPLDDEPLTKADRRALDEVDWNGRFYTNDEVADLLKHADRSLVR